MMEANVAVDRSAFRKVAAVLERHRRARIRCPEVGCAGRLILRRGNGRFFWGCERYPACRSSHPADQETGKLIGTPVARALRPAARQQADPPQAGKAATPFRDWEIDSRVRRRVILEQE